MKSKCIALNYDKGIEIQNLFRMDLTKSKTVYSQSPHNQSLNLMTMFKIKLLALKNGIILILWKMISVYDNKHFILFPLQQTKTVLKFWSTCKTLKPLIQFNKYPWNTYFLEPIVSHVNMTKMKNEKCALKN